MQNLPSAYHFAAADLPVPPHQGWISQQWELARRQLHSAGKVVLVLDEAQKISHWSEEVKRLWDEDSRLGNNIQVVILGSSALLKMPVPLLSELPAWIWRHFSVLRLNIGLIKKIVIPAKAGIQGSKGTCLRV